MIKLRMSFPYPRQLTGFQKSVSGIKWKNYNKANFTKVKEISMSMKIQRKMHKMIVNPEILFFPLG